MSSFYDDEPKADENGEPFPAPPSLRYRAKALIEEHAAMFFKPDYSTPPEDKTSEVVVLATVIIIIILCIGVGFAMVDMLGAESG